MAAIAADRNLLFGLLALQNGLINQVQLVAAFQAWTLDRSRSLADHLATRGDLDEDDRVLVEAMAARHIKKHGGDLEQSLSAINAGRSTRESLARLADADIEASLAHLGSQSTQASEDADRTTTYSVGSSTSDGQRFRVLRPHARGGLGAVFVALDQELHREVALKQILDSHADDPDSRQRFLLEAEVTGGLEHPGIVPVYGLGTYGGGRPYYAMRFIRGDSLKEAIARFHADETLKKDAGRRSLELRKLLRRFTDVCNAIDYAHSRGVLHRDIKPGNIIIGKYGETLVVDWGMAKARGHGAGPSEEPPLTPVSASGSADTLPGSALGTPAYMSPEQARGDLDALGPRSDVCSLGGTLYCLLTGTPPQEGDDIGEIMRKVQRGEFRPPRQLDPSIDKALEAVCLKAMALKPEDRYASCRALAEDIERWMADEPVSARGEPYSERVRRWARRHRPLVAGAAGLLLATVVGLAAGAVLLGRANALTEKRRREAVASREQAERHYELARAAVERYFTRVSEDRLLNEPHMEGLRKDLLETAGEFYQRLVAERGDEPAAQTDLAQSYLRLAAITKATESRDAAIQHASQALTLFRELDGNQPGTLRFRRGLADSLSSLGDLYGQGRVAQSEEAFRQAIALWELVARDEPGDRAARSELARNWMALANTFNATGRFPQAEDGYQRALDILELLGGGDPASEADRGRLALCLLNVANLRVNRHEPEAAERYYRRSLAIYRPILAAHPERASIRDDLARAAHNLGLLLAQSGRTDEAVEFGTQAEALWAGLARDFSSVADYRRQQAHALNVLFLAHRAARRLDLASSCNERAIALRETLWRAEPGSFRLAIDLGGSYGNQGILLDDRGDPRGALPWLDRSIETLQAALTREPRHVQVRLYLRNNYRARGRVALVLNRPADAAADFDRALAMDDGSRRQAIRLDRATAWARAGEPDRAVAEAEVLLTAGPPSGELDYSAACVFSQASTAHRLQAGNRGDGGSQVERDATRAVALLARAAAAGWLAKPNNLRWAQTDPDLNPMRDRSDFRLLMMDVAFPQNPFSFGP